MQDSSSLSDAMMICGRILRAPWSDPEVPLLMLALVLIVWLYQFLYESHVRPILATGFIERNGR